jgi:hypothetical protein
VRAPIGKESKMNDNTGNPLEQLTGQYKKGYRTSEFWIALLVGLVQTVAASFNPNQALKAQLSNLTWVGISYILARSGLKVARLTSASRVVAAVAAVSPPASTATSASAATVPATTAYEVPDPPSLQPPT